MDVALEKPGNGDRRCKAAMPPNLSGKRTEWKHTGVVCPCVFLSSFSERLMAVPFIFRREF